MSQISVENKEAWSRLPDAGLTEYLRGAGDSLAEESALLGQIISHVLASGSPLSNKAIIAVLIGTLEATDDVVAADVIRKTLEIVLDHTVDDI